jgi:murein DD-endopeptidase MepM/ murein hydrolase activator NlpD
MANNLSLNDTFQGLGNAIENVGSVAAQVRKSRKAVDVGKYKNVTSSTPTLPTQSMNMSTAQSTTPFLNKGTMTTPYGGQTAFEGFHHGVDIAEGMNAPVVSEAPGKVVAVQTGKKQGDTGFGNSVIVEDAYGNKYRYSHLNQAWVKVGDTLKRGSVIGAEGNTGSTYSTSGGTGAHLDFRIKNAYNQYVNPISFLQSFNKNG